MTDIALQSDEDFLNSMEAELEKLATAEPQEQGEQGQEPREEIPSAEADADAQKDNAETPEVNSEEANPDASQEEEEKEEPKDNTNPSEAESEPTGEGSDESGKAKEVDKPTEPVKETGAGDAPKQEQTNPEVEAPNYEELYKKVTAPFKANGKQFEIRSPEEAVKLMQLGANYGKKMQELKPVRKAVAMLENAGLLGNEADLSLLISIKNGDKEALKKYMKDQNIDPFDLDMNAEPQYAGPVNLVSDAEVAFRSTLDEVTSLEGGQETIQLLQTTLDPMSREEVWKDPSIISQLHEARSNGSFKLITDEMERRKTFGYLHPDTPFLQAYVAIGNELAQQRQPQNQPLSGQMDTRQPATPTHGTQAVATRPATPRPEVQHGDKARSAAPSQSRPAPARVVKNPLAMSDEEFLKSFGNLEF